MVHSVIGTVSAHKVVLKLENKKSLLPNNRPFSFTAKGNQALFELPVVGFATTKDLGSTRIATEDDILELIKKAKHFQRGYLLAYLENLSQYELSQIKLSFIFQPYKPRRRISEHLEKMLFCLYNTDSGSATGKIDYAALEKDFEKYIRIETLSDYIPRARNRSYLQVLSHNKKIVKGGK